MIYKAFDRLHLDYGNIIHYKAYNASFQPKLESIQHNTALAITGATHEISKEKKCEEPGLESLQLGRQYRKVCCFYKFLFKEKIALNLHF